MTKRQRRWPVVMDFKIRPTITLRVVENSLMGILNPIPTRMTLTRWVKNGILEGVKSPSGYWLVYLDSFENFVRNLQSEIAA